MGTAVMEAVKDALELRLKDRAQAEKYVTQMHDDGWGRWISSKFAVVLRGWGIEVALAA